MFTGDKEPGRYADHGIKVERAILVEGDEAEKVVKGHGGGGDLTATRCFGGHRRGDLACVLLLHAGQADLEMTSARAPWGECMNRTGIRTSGALLRWLLAVGWNVEGVGLGRGGGGGRCRDRANGTVKTRDRAGMNLPCMSVVLRFLILFFVMALHISRHHVII